MTDSAPLPTDLSETQRRILSLLSHGVETREIAKQLHRSEDTVKQQIRAVFLKWKVHNRAHAVAVYLRVEHAAKIRELRKGTSPRSGSRSL